MDCVQEALLEDGTSVGKPDVVAGLFELIRTLRSAINNMYISLNGPRIKELK